MFCFNRKIIIIIDPYGHVYYLSVQMLNTEDIAVHVCASVCAFVLVACGYRMCGETHRHVCTHMRACTTYTVVGCRCCVIVLGHSRQTATRVHLTKSVRVRESQQLQMDESTWKKYTWNCSGLIYRVPNCVPWEVEWQCNPTVIITSLNGHNGSYNSTASCVLVLLNTTSLQDRLHLKQ